MSKIVWDATGDRFFENGVDHAVLYPMGSNGKYTKGVPWNGITGVTESPDGAEPNDLYADNTKYATLRSAETFGATIEAYMYPEEFAVCDGSAQALAGVYIGQQARKAFGFCYRTNLGNDVDGDAGDDVYKLHIIYNATASPSERSYETINDSPDAITFSWEISTTPVAMEGNYKPMNTITIDTSKLEESTKTNFAKLLDELYGTDSTEPNLPSPEEVIAILTTGSKSAA